MKFKKIESDQEGIDFMIYRIQTPKDDNGNYNNNQMCTYNLPPPQREHVYEYLFPEAPRIEQSSTINLRCLDSLQFEHIQTENLSIPVITCGDEIDKRIDGHEIISDIRITFRSNEKVQRSGADFFISEYLVAVCNINLCH